MNIQDYEDFKELIQDLITQEIELYLKNNYIFRGVSGIITKINEDETCNINIISTELKNIKNKSGVELSIGDSVTLLERIGSNYSNCFIFIKNG